jgi:hypothetical protein
MIDCAFAKPKFKPTIAAMSMSKRMDVSPSNNRLGGRVKLFSGKWYDFYR